MTEDLFGKRIFSARLLEAGETWRKFDIMNCAEGLRRVPARMIGSKIKCIQFRDIFLRPISPPANLTDKEWEEWTKLDY